MTAGITIGPLPGPRANRGYRAGQRSAHLTSRLRQAFGAEPGSARP
jgi:hypothetical protein